MRDKINKSPRQSIDDSEYYNAFRAMNFEGPKSHAEVEKIKASELNFEQIKISVGNGRVVTEGVFSSSYLIYSVNTEAGFVKMPNNKVISTIGWTIPRKDADFYYLRRHLLKVFPYKIVPPLPPKKKKSGMRFMKRREKFFTHFMQAVFRAEEFKSDPFLLDFVKITDPQAFECAKRDYERMKFANDLENVKSVKGRVPVEQVSNSVLFSRRMAEFAENCEIAYTNIIKQSKDVGD